MIVNEVELDMYYTLLITQPEKNCLVECMIDPYVFVQYQAVPTRAEISSVLTFTNSAPPVHHRIKIIIELKK